MGGSSDHWRQQLWYFVTRGYEVVAPDLMGHGLSSAPKDPEHYTFSQMLDQITLVFDLFVPQGRKCSIAAALARSRVSSVRLVIMASCGGPSPLMPNPPNKSFLHTRLAAFLSPFLACGCCR
ncbi:Protein ABHD8 [Portunus trituberculatus]|uniref:Protein ABHD8 n=1 Tax=Portunus trituberculatus TaxID=210409 RepID=A0A5B7IJP5_PORTR|nr:Protein ABHD8 [Portunus trituberculatus]